MLEQVLAQLENELLISPNEILNIASRFQEHMEKGLRGDVSSLKMLPSYLQAPSGNESGTFLALDFGGTNVRSAVIELKGNGQFLELNKRAQPLLETVIEPNSESPSKSGRDLRGADVTAEELFDFLAKMINNTLNSSIAGSLPLGFTFSFPYRQQTLAEGFLLNWDKEIKTAGVVGKDVGHLLSKALRHQGLGSMVELVAILNDTVATFLAAAYQDPCVDIASIIGTGHNTCYLEQNAPGFDAPVIINMESGNFSAAPQNAYDLRLDQSSDNPGEQRFEKMLSGKYIGELFRQIVFDLSRSGLLGTLTNPPTLARWDEPYSITGKDLALILAKDNTHSTLLPYYESFTLQRIAHLLIKRSARLVAASLLGVVRHLDPHLNKSHTVAIDGSLYQGIPHYAEELKSALNESLKNKAGLVTLKLSAGGSLTGAAIAAAHK